MTFGQRIKELRKKNNLSQLSLAKTLNISRPSITKYERNERQPKFEMLIVIADYFNVSTDYLVGRTRKKK